MKKILKLTAENSSESGSFVFARMTTERMYSIEGTTGMLVYATDLQEFFYYNGVEWLTLSEKTKPGTLEMFAGSLANIPDGYLYCDGNPYNSLLYPDLYASIEKSWGSQDIATNKTIVSISATTLTLPYIATVTTSAPHTLQVNDVVIIAGTTQAAYNTSVTVREVTANTFVFHSASQVASAATGGYYRYSSFANGGQLFNVPDTRGLFARGIDGVAGYDPDKATRTARYTGGNTGNNVGTYQTDAYMSHNHTSPGHTHTDGGHGHSLSVGIRTGYSNSNTGYPGTGASDIWTWSPSTNTGYANIQSTAVTINSSGGTETRPKNFSINYIIKY